MERKRLSRASDYQIGETVVIKTGEFLGQYGQVVKIWGNRFVECLVVPSPDREVVFGYLPSHGDIAKIG